MKILIKHDVFNIANRIKQINKNYFIVFNKQTNKFEVHNKTLKNTLCLVLPFKQLDVKTLTYVLKSEKIDEQFLEIEKNNKKIENSNSNKIKDKITYQLKEIYNYANKQSTDFNGEAFKFEWC